MTENTKPTETGGENDSESKDGAQRILDFGAAITRTPHGNVYCLTIIGQIEGHTTAPNTAKTTKYEHVQMCIRDRMVLSRTAMADSCSFAFASNSPVWVRIFSASMSF